MSNKYVILNAEKNGLTSQSDWLKKIADFINFEISQKTISIIEINPQKSSYIYELDTLPNKVKINGKTLLYTTINQIPHSKVDILVETEEFYLGNSFILVSLIDERKLKDLANLWYKNPAETELEILSMGNDGNSFYWFNPAGLNYELRFNNFFDG